MRASSQRKERKNRHFENYLQEKTERTGLFWSQKKGLKKDMAMF